MRREGKEIETNGRERNRSEEKKRGEKRKDQNRIEGNGREGKRSEVKRRG